MRTLKFSFALLPFALVGCADVVPTAPPSDARALRGVTHGQALPFHGTLESSHTSRYDPESNTIYVHLVGTGTASHLGRYTLTSDLELDASTIAGPERVTLTAANGDRLFAEGTAQGTPAEDGLSVNSLETLTITGGTGRFADATGGFVLRQVNLDVSRIATGTFEGTITLGH